MLSYFLLLHTVTKMFISHGCKQLTPLYSANIEGGIYVIEFINASKEALAKYILLKLERQTEKNVILFEDCITSLITCEYVCVQVCECVFECLQVCVNICMSVCMPMYVCVGV